MAGKFGGEFISVVVDQNQKRMSCEVVIKDCQGLCDFMNLTKRWFKMQGCHFPLHYSL